MSGEQEFRAVVLCDLGPALGVGHLMRCIALAEQLSASGGEVVFVADTASVPWGRTQLEQRGYRHLPLPGAGVEDRLAMLRRLRPDVVVIDSYLESPALYARAVEECFTVAIVDGDPGGRAAHVLVDQNIGAEHDTWSLPADTLRLAGLEYALIRREITAQRPTTPEPSRDGPVSVFAFFGGTDPFGAGPVLTQALVDTGMPFSLTVVAPAPWPRAVAAGTGQEIELIAPTQRLGEHVRGADLVVSGAGSSSWELFCLGAACCMTCLTENQELAYGRLLGTGTMVGVGHLEQLRSRPGLATKAFADILGDAGERSRLRRAAWDMVDGRGSLRVVDRVLSDSRFVVARG